MSELTVVLLVKKNVTFERPTVRNVIAKEDKSKIAKRNVRRRPHDSSASTGGVRHANFAESTHKEPFRRRDKLHTIGPGRISICKVAS